MTRKPFATWCGRLGRILEEAEECQVHLLIEPHGTFSLTAEGLNKIMGLCSSKWLGINFDTANVHRAGLAPRAEGSDSSISQAEKGPRGLVRRPLGP